MKRNDVICDLCGKVIDPRYDLVTLKPRGVGAIFNWTAGLNGTRVDLCTECWDKFIYFMDKKGDCYENN